MLQAELGDGVLVIPDGLNGRTTAFDDHLAGADRNGARILPTVLTTHAPLDLIVIMLGANDMKPWIHGNPVAAKQGMERLVDIVRGHDYPFGWSAPKILLVSPPAVSRTDNAEFKEMFAGGDAASQRLARLYAELAGLDRLRLLRRRQRGEDHAARRRPSRRREHAGHRARARACCP